MNKKTIAGGLLAVISIGLFIAVSQKDISDTIFLTEDQTSISSSQTERNEPEMDQKQLEEAKIVIDVDGAVAKPGIVILPAESRVYNAIDEAGGLKLEADTSTINLAAKLNDGEKIYIPDHRQSETQNQGVNNQGLININTANSDTLQKLKVSDLPRQKK